MDIVILPLAVPAGLTAIIFVAPLVETLLTHTHASISPFTLARVTVGIEVNSPLGKLAFPSGCVYPSPEVPQLARLVYARV